MTSPIDYTQALQSPFQSLVQGYSAGAGIRDDQQQQQQLQVAQQQQQQLLAARHAVIQNPTAANYSTLMLLDPKSAEATQKAWATRSADQQQAFSADLGGWGSALINKQPQLVVDALNQQADGLESAAGGPTQDSQSKRDLAKLVQAHPDVALGKIIALADANPNGKQVADGLRQQLVQPATTKKAGADADLARTMADVAAAGAPDEIMKKILANKDTASQINDRAKRYGLDVDKFRSEMGLKVTELSSKLGELPEFVAKDVTSAATDSIAAQQSAVHMVDLASRLEALYPASGLMARAGEAIKRITGSQDEFTRLRSEYSRIVTPAAMAAYKQVASGSTSDKDIETAMTGVPSDTANSATMASFLRGAAKLQVYDSVLSNARSEWLQSVHSLGKSKSDITVDGVTVPAGTTFKDFTDAYVAKKVSAQVNANDLATRGYMKYANPGSATPDPLTDAMTAGAGQ